MGSTSANRGLILPSVGGDPGVWGSELNQTIVSLDTILGAQSVFQSSVYGTNFTPTSSQAQVLRMVCKSTGSGPFTLNLKSSNYALGNYSIANFTQGPLTIAAAASGTNTVIGASLSNFIFSDGTNILPSTTISQGSAATENIATGAQFLAGTTGFVVDTTTVAGAVAQTFLPNLAGGNYGLDFTTFIYGTATITANTTLLLTNGANLGAVAGQWRNLILYQDGAGAHTLTTGAGFAPDNGAAAIPIGANAVNGTHISFFIRGANYVEVMVAARGI